MKTYVETDVDREQLADVILAECKIIESMDALRTSQLKGMLTQAKRMYKELDRNYE